MQLNIDCRFCTGHGLGNCGEESRCTPCKGRGYFTIDTSDLEWIEHCEEENLDPETGEKCGPY